MLSRADAIGCVEAAYRFDTDANWMDGVTDALFRALKPDLGIGGYLYQKRESGVALKSLVFRNLHPEFIATAEHATPQGDWAHPPAVSCVSLVHLARKAGVVGFNADGEVFGPHSNIFSMYASNLVGAGAAFVMPQNHLDPIEPKYAETLLNISVHVAAADRLRRQYGRVTVDSGSAVFTPDGKLLHATPDAQEGELLQDLASEVAQQDRARGRMRREEPDQALATWRGLVQGRWSLVEVVESDEKRFLVAVENAHGVRDPRALTQREAEVSFFAANGHSNFLIAYELGLGTPTVATHLRSALAKLKLQDRTELVRIGPAAFLTGDAVDGSR